MDCVLHWDENTERFIAFDKDPCPDCKHPTCKNVGKPHLDKRLLILPGKLVINYYGGFNVKCPHCDKEVFINVKVQ